MTEAFDLNFLWVFLVGVLSFFSPCNFALIPAFIAYISGTSSVHGKVASRWNVMLSSFMFVLGFMLIFLLIGASAGAIGQFFSLNQDVFRVVAGIFIILIGLLFVFHLNVGLFKRDFHFSLPGKLVKYKKLKAFLAGMAISFGWSPCYGPLIGAIFTLTLTAGSVASGILYFAIYSLGFVIPFLILALFMNACMKYMNRIKGFLKYFNIAAGLILITIGLFMISDKMLGTMDVLYKLYDSFGIPYIS